jgi:hypothetical protein
MLILSKSLEADFLLAMRLSRMSKGLHRSRLLRSFCDGGTGVSTILCSDALADVPLSSSQAVPCRSGFSKTAATPSSDQKLKVLQEKSATAVLAATN